MPKHLYRHIYREGASTPLCADVDVDTLRKLMRDSPVEAICGDCWLCLAYQEALFSMGEGRRQ